MGGKKDLVPFMEYLKELFPDAVCELTYNSPFQLLVATILSAQCTDKQVNKVTPVLFEKYPDANSMAKASIENIEEIIHSTGFYKNKAKNIKNMACELVENHAGCVPDNMEELVKLSGVGRKTANVVLGNVFQVPGIVVDTHVKRITNRYGLTKNTDPEKIEKDLMKIFPKEKWTMLSHQLVLFGRYFCMAKNPKCDECKIISFCTYKKKISMTKKG